MVERFESEMRCGAPVFWGGRTMVVEFVTPRHVHVCPFALCINVTHEHIRVVRWLLVWDGTSGCFRALWDRPGEAA